MAYTGKKPVDVIDVTESQSLTVTEDLTVDTDTLHVDSTNNRVGIGTTSPREKLDVTGDVIIESAFDGTQFIRNVDVASVGLAGHYIGIGAKYNGNPVTPVVLAGATDSDGTAGSFSIRLDDSEKMRIDSSGHARFGNAVTQIEPRNYTSSNQVGAQLSFDTGDGHEFATPTGLFFNNTQAGSTSLAVVSIRRRGSVTGSITNTATATAFNTSSDYRLKENITGIADGIERVKQLNPSRFNFIADTDTTVDGFLAHEAATVVPEAVTGEKDAVDDEGNPGYQGIDQAKLVPLLTAALQEAIAKIEALETQNADFETRIAALEAN